MMTVSKHKSIHNIAMHRNFCFLLCIDVVIGFNQTLYEVSEDARQATVYVVLVNGILRRPVVVSVSTRDGTALSKFSLNRINTILLLSLTFRW